MLKNNKNNWMNTDIQIRDYSKKFYYGGEKDWHHEIKDPIPNATYETNE